MTDMVLFAVVALVLAFAVGIWPGLAPLAQTMALQVALFLVMGLVYVRVMAKRWGLG